MPRCCKHLAQPFEGAFPQKVEANTSAFNREVCYERLHVAVSTFSEKPSFLGGEFSTPVRIVDSEGHKEVIYDL